MMQDLLEVVVRLPFSAKPSTSGLGVAQAGYEELAGTGTGQGTGF